MPASRERHSPILVTAILVAALTGCAGGSDTKIDTDMEMTGDTDTGTTGETGTDMPEERTLTIRDGLARSMATPVYADDADDTLETLLPDSANQFAPLTSAVEVDDGTSTAATGESHIKAISSDGDNGFHVTYVVGGDERMIHFEEADYSAEQYNYYKEVDGVEYWLWSHTNSYHGTDKNRGSVHYDYVDVSGFVSYHDEDDSENGGVADWNSLSYGARTDAASLPAGSATYAGIVDADSHLRTDPSRAHRHDMKGVLRLTANFDDSTVDGMILGIRTRMRRQDGSFGEWTALPETTHFELGDGQIVDGQFAATLTGVDSNAAASLPDTVSGYEGGILGEFYGPAAEEVGGVLTASRQDRVMGGVFAGKQEDSDADAAESLIPSPISPVFHTDDDLGSLVTLPTLASGIRRDSYALRSELATDAYIKSIGLQDADDDAIPTSLHVTYVVGDEEVTVHFTVDDRDTPDFDESWTKTVDGDTYWGWIPRWNNQEESFGFIGGASGDRYYAATGLRTATANLPSGTAVYEGGMRGDTHLSSDPSSAHRESIRGSLRLTAKFDESSLEGRISGIRVRPQVPRGWMNLPDTTYFAIGDGQIMDGRFTASLTGMDSNANAPMSETVRGYEGGVLGEFYGPAAEEVGGVLNASREGRVMAGVFGGVKQQ